METIIKNYKEKYGYSPTIFEIYNLYKEGSLSLSDKEENALIIETLKKVVLIKKELGTNK